MKLMYPAGQGSWVVELTEEEIRNLDPSHDINWKVHFLNRLEQLQVSKLVRHKLAMAVRNAVLDRRSSGLFLKNGRLLSFEEWMALPEMELSILVTQIRGLGPEAARQVVRAARKLNQIVLV